MCSSSSSSTTKNKTAPLSAEGREWNSLFQQIVMNNLQDIGGYDISGEEVTDYSDPAKADKYQNNISKIEDKIAALDADMAKNPMGPSKTRAGASADPRVAQRTKLERDLAEQQKKLDKLDVFTYTDYKLKKKEDPRVLQAIEQYGENSSEVKAIRTEIKQAEIDKAQSMADIEENYLASMKKLTSGDLSYTDEQREQVDRFFGPIKDIINKFADDATKLASTSNQTLRGVLDQLGSEIDKTGYAVADALKAAEIQVEKTGSNMLDILKDVNTNARSRAKFEFDKLSEDIETKVDQQAALLGLPPNSKSAQLQKLKEKQDALKSIELNLTQQELLGRLDIEEKTGADKKAISMSRVALAASQGEKKENVVANIFGLERDFANKKDSILGTQANALLATEQAYQDQLLNQAYGNLPMIMQAAQSGIGFGTSQKGAELAVSGGLLAPVAQARSIEEQRTFAENTSKTNTTQKGSFLDAFTDLVGAGASVAGMFTGTGGGGGGGGGGGSRASTGGLLSNSQINLAGNMSYVPPSQFTI